MNWCQLAIGTYQASHKLKKNIAKTKIFAKSNYLLLGGEFDA